MVEDDYLLRRQLTIIGNVERTKLFPFPMRENCEEKAGLDTPFVCHLSTDNLEAGWYCRLQEETQQRQRRITYQPNK